MYQSEAVHLARQIPVGTGGALGGMKTEVAVLQHRFHHRFGSSLCLSIGQEEGKLLLRQSEMTHRYLPHNLPRTQQMEAVQVLEQCRAVYLPAERVQVECPVAQLAQSHASREEVLVGVVKDKEGIETHGWQQDFRLVYADGAAGVALQQVVAPLAEETVAAAIEQDAGNAVNFKRHAVVVEVQVLDAFDGILARHIPLVQQAADTGIIRFTDIEVDVPAVAPQRMGVIECHSLSFEQHGAEAFGLQALHQLGQRGVEQLVALGGADGVQMGGAQQVTIGLQGLRQGEDGIVDKSYHRLLFGKAEEGTPGGTSLEKGNIHGAAPQGGAQQGE